MKSSFVRSFTSVQEWALRALVVVLAGCLAGVGARAQPLSVSTFVGQPGLRGSADGTGAAARFFGPSGLVFDSKGNLYVADALNNLVRKVSTSGLVTTVAGGTISELTNLPARGFADGTGRDALFSTGLGITAGAEGPLLVANYGALCLGVDGSSNVYLADTLNQVIRRISVEGVVTTLAGSPGTLGSVDGTGSAAQFSSPFGVAVTAEGIVYVTDAGNNTIRKVTAAGVVTTLAGRDGSNAGTSDGSGANARFNNPTGIALDRAGNLFVTDSNNHTIRKITPAGVVTTFAGSPGLRGSADGLGSFARFNSPSGLTVDSAGTVYVADTGNATIRKITSAGIVSTVAGLAGLSGNAEGTGNAARFVTPYAVAVDAAGALYIADSGNNAIRKATAGGTVPTVSLQTQPKTQYVNIGQTVVFSVGATGSSALTYQWKKNGTNVAGATNATFTLSSAQQTDEGSFFAVVTSGVTTVTSSVAVLQVYPASVVIPPVIIITQPADQTVTAGQPAVFAIEVAGSATPLFQWQKDEVNIAGATSATFTLAAAQAGDAAPYRVVMTAGGTVINSAPATLSVTPAVTEPPPPPPPPPPANDFGRIINLSILTAVPAGGETFTMGYVVGGNGTTGAKPLVIRAAGPSLGALGVGGTLADPKLELYAGSTKTGENDNWGGSAQLTAALAAVGAFAYTSPTSKDAATTASITSRDNSVVVSAADKGAGLVIAEIYDATVTSTFTTTTPRLVNVSVRKELGTGLTVGFVLGGAKTTKVLIRAVGPTLGVFGVPGVVADPQLALFNGQSVKIGENNDWGGTAELTAAFNAVGAFGLGATSKDAAVLVTLQPGSYSVQVSGVANTSGVALVEVYEVP